MMHPIVCCPKCNAQFNTVKQPHLLPCSHTLCSHCVQKIVAPSCPSPSPSCPFCSQALPSSNFPINSPLAGLVECMSIATRSQVGEFCQLHDGQHVASFWCCNCEKGLCGQGKSTHAKTPATRQHKVIASNAQKPNLRRPASCAAHEEPLELVCTHASHAPRMVCAACVQAKAHRDHAHHGHASSSVVDYFGTRCKLAQEVVAQAQAQARAQQGIAETPDVWQKMNQDIEKQLDELREQVGGTKPNLEKMLHTKMNSLYSILHAITEKLRNGVPQDENEGKGLKREDQREARDLRGQDYEGDDREEEDEEDEEDGRYYAEGDDSEPFSGGRKNEAGGGKASLARHGGW